MYKNRKTCVESWVQLSAQPNSNTSPNPHLQKVLQCRMPCHTWESWLGIMCEVVSRNFHALNG